ncbi:MAG: ArsR/SmtB family transcription factor [Planctomycetota bacterium]|jgi:DNA-binding transcriptional ArsR family regulator
MRNIIGITKALSDENRVRALMMLRKGELCVCQLIEVLRLAPSTVSKHMAVLYQVGLVDARKQGRWNYYRLADGDAPQHVLEAIRWVRKSMAKDRQIVADARQVKSVCKMDKERLSDCYKKGKLKNNDVTTQKRK